MSLITCCPTCRTMFKVVADQLKVSDGWVRCGQCDAVFDASAHFQAIPEAPLPEQLEQSELTARVEPKVQELYLSAPELMADQAPVAAPAPLTTETAAPPAAVPRFLTHSYLDDASISAPLSSYLSVHDSADASAHDVHEPSGASPSSKPFNPLKPVKPVTSAKTEDVRRPARSELTFVQSAQRRDQPKHPVLRLLSALLAIALLAGLLLQILLHDRDALAARYPAVLPALQTLCQTMKCQINPPRAIEAVLIDSSSFTQTGPDAYRLNVVLKNRRLAAVAMPALELTLTGSQNEVLVRKVLLPAELGASSDRLEQATPFAGVFNLQLTLSAAPVAELPASSSSLPASSPEAVDSAPAVSQTPAGLPITGYRLFVFYP